MIKVFLVGLLLGAAGSGTVVFIYANKAIAFYKQAHGEAVAQLEALKKTIKL